MRTPPVRSLVARLLRKLGNRAKSTTRRVLRTGSLAAAERLNERLYVGLEYPPSAVNGPRYGHGRPPHDELEKILCRNDDVYRVSLQIILSHADDLRQIERQSRDPREPSWINDFLPGLDSAAIYAFLREWRPRRYIEIGSGHSTTFAARAKRDGQLTTEIISIDPHPRSEIDGLCDRVIRSPLESADLGLFGLAEAGDVVFFDGSHRVFMNSDVTVFFLEVLPRLAPGVLVGVHDVYLPDDYPPEISERYYSEQYLLACWLLAGENIEPVLPAAYVGRNDSLRGVLSALWDAPELQGVPHHGATFWWRVARPAAAVTEHEASAGSSAS
jgi:predicted O-methyltransferase YrrM